MPSLVLMHGTSPAWAGSVVTNGESLPMTITVQLGGWVVTGSVDVPYTALLAAGNIYSHLIPTVFFLLGEWYIQQYLAKRYSEVTGADFIAFSIFMLAAVFCLSLSATYHTLMNHSQHVEHFCLRLDMLGVLIFILADLVLGTYMVFWCKPLPRDVYWFMVSLTPYAQLWFSSSQTWYLSLTLFFPRLIDSRVFGTLTIFMTMHPKFQGAKYRLFRALMFVATGLSGVTPLIHGLTVLGILQIEKSFSLYYGKSRLSSIRD